jgi:TorA maturation chaperone TorD
MERLMSNTPDHTGALTCGLRDFFAAADGRGLAQAYARIAADGATPPPPADWDETEYAFNRLFVGPGPLAAPPYSSVYLDPEPRLMGRSTSLTRAVLQAVGLESAWIGSIPDDHVAVELDAALALRSIAAAAGPGPDGELAALRRYFVAGHMARWVPRFADRVLGQLPLPGPIVTATRKLELWLEAELASLPPDAGAAPARDIPQPSTGGDHA